jgi:hypothetical protein
MRKAAISSGQLDLRNSEIFNRTLFTRDDQVQHPGHSRNTNDVVVLPFCGSSTFLTFVAWRKVPPRLSAIASLLFASIWCAWAADGRVTDTQDCAVVAAALRLIAMKARMRSRNSTLTVLVLAVLACGLSAMGADGSIAGQITDPQGGSVPDAQIRLVRRADNLRRETKTDRAGRYSFSSLDAGEYQLTAEAVGFPQSSKTVVLGPTQNATADFLFSQLATQSETVTVTADVSDASVFLPDPGTRVMVRQETLDANPGRPGMPISIPGMPVESPAGGIKPPQYFVPGVAGDHGEPIAQFFQIGSFLFPNNLPANAHGNRYADPNTLIPIAIESVATDGGAFNVREGNNSVNSAMVFGLRDRLDPLIRITGDYRNVDLLAGWSPRNSCGQRMDWRRILLRKWLSETPGTSQAVQGERLARVYARQARPDGLRHRVSRVFILARFDPDRYSGS